jgi:hypothetical protein
LITSHTFYPFGGKVATVETPAFNCVVSTAKDGLFKKQSVIISVFNSNMSDRRQVAKLQYHSHLDKKARLGLHGPVVHLIDEFGMNGKSLREALTLLFQKFQQEGIGYGIFLEDI